MKQLEGLLSGVIALVCAGCTATVADAGEIDGEVGPAGQAAPIIGGVLATEYPEAALLNMRTATGSAFACSAAVIAPRVVLTAGHCVDGMSFWEVSLNGVTRQSKSAETYDWNENGSTQVNPLHHDIGLVYLEQRLNLATYPTLAQSALAEGSNVYNVGRILNNTFTNKLYRASVDVLDGRAIGYPLDYYSKAVIEHGDSGGPVFKAGTHLIVGVNSGAGGDLQVMARVDLLRDWIAARVAEHGGAARVLDLGAGLRLSSARVRPRMPLGAPRN